VAAMRHAPKVDTAARRIGGKAFALHACVNDKATSAAQDEKELTEPEKRANVVRLAFDDDPAKLDRFIELIKGFIPENTGVVLRGSAVTGFRWKDGSPFDVDGPGTSDLDLTFVGQRILEYYKVTGFFVPGVHSRPISKDDPDIAPDLIPLREALMAMVKRPVNIQGTRDFVMYVRGELLGQPYLTLVEKSDIE
jgi:hypothetical protein